MGTINTPIVSVVMAVYNGEQYLRETVSSILSQTFTDFELLIINDGSTDATSTILANFSDPRITAIHNENNRGLPYSLNRGLKAAKGKYIARMDVGDLAFSERFGTQVSFLEKHPEIGILGSGCVIIDDSGEQKGTKKYPCADLDIRWCSLLDNPLLHPSVMLRREVLVQHQLKYDTSFQSTQDYELWTRMLEHTKGANLREPLVMYRRSDESITAKRRDEQLENHDRVALRTIRSVLPEFQISAEQVKALREAFVGGDIPRNQREVHKVRLAGFYLDLLTAFVSKYRTHPDVRKLKRREVSNVCKIVFQRKYSAYWLPVLTRGIRLYPGIPYFLLRRIIRRSFKRLI